MFWTSVVLDGLDPASSRDVAGGGRTVAVGSRDIEVGSSWPERGPGLVVEPATEVAGGRVVVRAAGELDMSTAPTLLAELTRVAGSGCTHVDLDLLRVRFCDGSGLAVLLEGRRRIAEGGGGVTVHDPCPSLRRILDICDLTLTLQPRDTPRPGTGGRDAGRPPGDGG